VTVSVCTFVCANQQLERVETELCRSKSLRDRQCREFERQRDELLRTHAKQLAELQLTAELERGRLVEECRAQTELQRAEKDRELGELRQKMLADAADIQQRAKEQADNDAKVCYHQRYSPHWPQRSMRTNLCGLDLRDPHLDLGIVVILALALSLFIMLITMPVSGWKRMKFTGWVHWFVL